MKKAILALFSLAILSSCSKNQSESNLHLTGNIKGFSLGKLYIQKAADSSFVNLDSIQIDGKSTFDFNLNIEEPEMLFLIIDRGTTNSLDDRLPFFAEPGKITIESQLQQFYSNAKITGSHNQDLYENYKQVNSKFTNQNLEYMKHILNAQKHNLSKKLDSLLVLQNSNIKRKYLYTINFAITHKDQAIAPYLALVEIPDANIKYLDTIYKSLTPEIARSKYGIILEKYITELKNL